MFDNGTSSIELMSRAGKACATAFDYRGRVAIVCGKGNNAGDGYVLALELINNNVIKKSDLDIYLLTDSFSDSGKFYFDKCKIAGISIKPLDANVDLSTYDIIVDAILGVGVKSGLSELYINAIESINNAKKKNENIKIVSIDINSGLNSDTGLYEHAVSSDMTISIGNYKSGHFLNKAKDIIKNKMNVDIGIKMLSEPYSLYEESDLKNIFKKRENFSHKASYGKVSLVGGSTEYSGAIRLANLSLCSLRAGAGLSTIAVPKYLVNVVSENILESMIFPIDSTDSEIIFNKQNIDDLMSKSDVIACGMGLGRSDAAVEIVKYLITNFDGRLLLDADALYILSKNIGLLQNKKPKIILTPHMKEYERLLLGDIARIMPNGLPDDIKMPEQVLYDPEALKSFAKKYNIIILLKGPTTIITDGKKVSFVDRGTAGMATAGSGDVLSGIIAGLLGYVEDEYEAVVAGAYINGAAGELAASEYGEISMLSSDTAKNVSKIIKKLSEGNYE